MTNALTALAAAAALTLIVCGTVTQAQGGDADGNTGRILVGDVNNDGVLGDNLDFSSLVASGNKASPTPSSWIGEAWVVGREGHAPVDGERSGEEPHHSERALSELPPVQSFRDTLTDRGWAGRELDVIMCVANHEDRSGVATNHEADGSHSFGILQLNTRGKLPDFYDRGYTDPLDVVQQANWVSDVRDGWMGTLYAMLQPWLNARKECLG